MRDTPVIAGIAGLVVGIAMIALFAIGNPVGLPNPLTYNSTKPPAAIISQAEAETVARDHLDRIAQSNGEQPGIYRGGRLGSAELIYVDMDGTNYFIDEPGDKLVEKLLHPIDGSKPDQYIWKITLDYGNSSKPEYIYAVDALDGEAWMIGVID